MNPLTFQPQPWRLSVNFDCPVMAMEAVCELSDCLATAMKATCEQSACPVKANDSFSELSVLLQPLLTSLCFLFQLCLIRFGGHLLHHVYLVFPIVLLPVLTLACLRITLLSLPGYYCLLILDPACLTTFTNKACIWIHNCVVTVYIFKRYRLAVNLKLKLESICSKVFSKLE